MLVISRKPGESFGIGDGIVVKIVEVRGDRVRLGIEAAREVEVNRHDMKQGRKDDGR